MNRRRGSVLGVVLMLTMLLAIITAVVANNTLANYKTTNWAGGAGTSRYIGFAGLQHAMLKLREYPQYAGTFEGDVPGQPELYYHVTVKNQTKKVEVRDRWGTVIGLEDPYSVTEIPENSAKIESEVRIRQTGATDRTLSGVIGTAVWKPTGFTNAASARSAMMMTTGANTRAYDFREYTFGKRDGRSTDMDSGYVDPLDVATDKKDGGHVQTADLMQIADTAKAEGDVTMPPVTDSEVAAAKLALLKNRFEKIAPDITAALPGYSTPTKDTHYTGAMKSGAAASVVPYKSPYAKEEATEVKDDFPGETRTFEEDYWDDDAKKWKKRTVTRTVPMTLPPNKAYKGIHLKSDQDLVLASGVYYISDEFKVDGDITLDASHGDVIVYVGKKMDVSGTINFYGDPAQIQVYFTDEDKPKDEAGNPIETAPGFSQLTLHPNSRSTMVAEGAGLITRMDNARLLGAISSEVVQMKNNASIDYDINLKGRDLRGGGSWKLQGVYETAGR